MTASEPHVAIDSLPGASATEVEKPPVTEGSGAAFTQWSASRSGEHVVLAGCVATPLPGWVEEMRPVVEIRTFGFATAAASKITRAPLDPRPVPDGTAVLRLAQDGPTVGRLKTFVGFDASHVFTCLAACARTDGHADEGETCGRIVATARLEGSSPPPPPGLLLGSATWAVHHPRVAGLGMVAVLVLGAFLAVVLRRRPRSKIA